MKVMLSILLSSSAAQVGMRSSRARHHACELLTGGIKAYKTTNEHGTHFGARQSAEL